MKKTKPPVTYETRYKHKLNMLELFGRPECDYDGAFRLSIFDVPTPIL